MTTSSGSSDDSIKLPLWTKGMLRDIAVKANAKVNQLREHHLREPQPHWAMSEEYKQWLRELDFTEEEIRTMDRYGTDNDS